jgi:hypothetical protein
LRRDVRAIARTRHSLGAAHRTPARTFERVVVRAVEAEVVGELAADDELLAEGVRGRRALPVGEEPRERPPRVAHHLPHDALRRDVACGGRKQRRRAEGRG